MCAWWLCLCLCVELMWGRKFLLSSQSVNVRIAINVATSSREEKRKANALNAAERLRWLEKFAVNFNCSRRKMLIAGIIKIFSGAPRRMFFVFVRFIRRTFSLPSVFICVNFLGAVNIHEGDLRLRIFYFWAHREMLLLFAFALPWRCFKFPCRYVWLFFFPLRGGWALSIRN